MARKRHSFSPAIPFLIGSILLGIGTGTSLAQELEMLERQGRNHYQQGEYQEAIAIWEQGILAADDRTRKATLFNNLSLAYQHIGQWEKAKKAIADSISLLQDTSNREGLAHAREIEGKLNFAIGQPEAALESWQEATKGYEAISNVSGKVRSQIHQSLAMQELGLYREAFNLLVQLDPPLPHLADSNLKGIGLRSLGNILLTLGEIEDFDVYWLQFGWGEDVAKGDYLQKADRLFEESYSLASSPRAKAATLLSWGNADRTAYFQAKDKFFRTDNHNLQRNAIQSARLVRDRYRSAYHLSPDPLARLQAIANELALSVDLIAWMQRNGERKETIAAIETILGQLPEMQQTLAILPQTRQTAYIRIHLAENVLKYSQIEGGDRFVEIARLLTEAARQGEELGDIRTRSLALGHLGNLYESQKRWSEARQHSETAILLARQIQATDLAYQWQWQLGRVLKAQQETAGAIAAYESAIATLRSVRRDLVNLNNPDIRFFFRDDVEPVYRELVSLLIDEARNEKAGKQTTKSIKNAEDDPLNLARKYVEELQLAELENFLRCELSTTGIEIDRIADREESKTAIVYPIILEDRLELIVKFPRKEQLLNLQQQITKKEIEETVERVRRAIQDKKIGEQDDSFQKLHQWLLAPIEEQLQADRIETLVFVLDGALKNVPMSVLYDGEKYAIEKYNLSLNLGLKLDSDRPLNFPEMQVLAAGVSEENLGLPALPSVTDELANIQSHGSNVNVLLNEKFTKKSLEEQMHDRPFSLLHLATHGFFTSDPKKTYILAYGDRISMDELSRLIQQGDRHGDRGVELLILSACQTAAGDKRATLGLAGVSIQAGAKSTLASLFVVSDPSTAMLMEHFYQALTESEMTKAEALRKAQLALLENEDYQKPYFWSPYVLIGNWR